jgi:prophage regulatory protein
MQVNERLIGRDELLSIIPYTVQHVLRLEKAGAFPKRVRVGGNRVAWVESEIQAWIGERMAARRCTRDEAAASKEERR